MDGLAPCGVFMDDVQSSARCCDRTQIFPAGTELFRQDETPHTVYCIERGMVKLSIHDGDGRAAIVGIRRPGWLLGTPAVVLDQPYAVTAETLTPCALRCIAAEELKERMEKDPSLSLLLAEMFCAEIYTQFKRIGTVIRSSARERLEQFFYDLLSAQEPTHSGETEPVRLHLPLRHWEIAQLLGVTPPYLCRVLKQMEREGVIRKNKGWIEVLDPQVLSPQPLPHIEKV